MKSLRIPGLPGVRRRGGRTAALALAALMGGGLTVAMTAGPALAATPNPAPLVTMGAAAQSASSVFLAYTATDSQVYLRNVVTGKVYPIGGHLIGGPAVVQTATGLAVFGRGTDNALWWRRQGTNGTWYSWQSLGGVITSRPGAAAGATLALGPVVVLARGGNGALWYKAQGSSGSWGGWHSLGGRLLAGTGPAATAVLTNLVVAVTGTDSHVWLYGPLGMQVSGFIDFGGATGSTPGIAPIGSNVVVFARGTNNALWYKTSILPIGNPAGWKSLDGKLTSGPAGTTVSGGKTYVFVVGTDGLPWMRNGIWPSLGPWTRA
jgi:hypothetical protein